MLNLTFVLSGKFTGIKSGNLIMTIPPFFEHSIVLAVFPDRNPYNNMEPSIVCKKKPPLAFCKRWLHTYLGAVSLAIVVNLW